MELSHAAHRRADRAGGHQGPGLAGAAAKGFTHSTALPASRAATVQAAWPAGGSPM
jgi:hypothetical protein